MRIDNFSQNVRTRVQEQLVVMNKVEEKAKQLQIGL